MAREQLAALGVVGLFLLACQGAPVDVGDGLDEPAPPRRPELAAGALIDLGTDATPTYSMEGFSLPERVGARLASWSEGELSTLSFDLRGGARSYELAYLVEPYHMLGDVPVGIALNKQPLIDTTIVKGWRAYHAVVPGARISAGRNDLSFHYSKTGRPSDFDPSSSDVRELSLRFEQIQVQPITARVELTFSSKNALALAALGDGWAHDPSDRGTGTWTIAERALIAFPIDPAEVTASVYSLKLSARAPRGAAGRSVNLTLNGAALGPLTFQEKKSTAVIDLPVERLKADNELALEFSKLEPATELDPTSKDTRQLGLRLFELTLEPKALASK